MLVHRGESEMGAIHDHGCWVAITPVTGVETHRHFRVHAAGTELERLELATELALRAGEATTMLAPDDIHSHGHVAGSGEPAYVLIMTGDDQRGNRRSEWDTATGRRRVLEPGDGGRWIDSEPFRRG
jgi:predicted metal-dependent enzyme (double-stranded beta helix superfamily)